MWLLTTLGAYSVACARTGDGRKTNPPDPNRLMVRGRVRKHLMNLQERFPELRQFPIHESTQTDYRFRLLGVPKETFAGVLADLARDLAYDNFKEAAARAEKTSRAYERALHDIWSVMYRLQAEVEERR